MNYYFKVLKKYAVSSGRASRREYWMFFLFSSLIIPVALIFISGLIGDDSFALVAIYQLAVVIPTIAVGVRRMHDINMSGWVIFIPLFNFIATCSAGTKGDNKYGPEQSSENEKGEVFSASEEKTESAFCYKCGDLFDLKSKFCQKCGAKVIHPSI